MIRYSGGESERRLGAALAGTPRHSYVLSTKVGRLVDPDGAVRFDFSRDGVRRSLDESLRRLRLNRVDVVLVHDPNDHYDVAVREAFPALADLRDQGVIGAIGAGMNQWPMLAEFAHHVDIDCFLKLAYEPILGQPKVFNGRAFARGKGLLLSAMGRYTAFKTAVAGPVASGPVT